MRWIDIILPEPETHQELDSLLAEAVVQLEDLEASSAATAWTTSPWSARWPWWADCSFRAVIAVDPQAFDPEDDRTGSQVPLLDDPAARQSRGLSPGHRPGLALPALDLAAQRRGIPAGKAPHRHLRHCSSRLPRAAPAPWMQRFQRAEFLVDDDGSDTLTGTLNQLLPPDQASPSSSSFPATPTTRSSA